MNKDNRCCTGTNYDKSVLAKTDASNIIESIYYYNRIFLDDEIVNCIRQMAFATEEFIEKDTVLYRSRMFDINNVEENIEKLGTKESKFQGYNETESFVNPNPDWGNNNRMSPRGIAALYLSNSEELCIREIQPGIGDIVNIAEVKTKEKLIIADFTKKTIETDNEYVNKLYEAFRPYISNGNEEKHYAFTQYIASLCDNIGFDGISYKSRFATEEELEHGNGINYSIFNYDKCKAISSKLRKVEKINIQYNEHTLDREKM